MLACFGSRMMQLVWGLLHFAMVGLFAVIVSLFIAEAATSLWQNLVNRGRGAESFGMGASDRESAQRRLYLGFALLIIFYTAVVSCAVESATPRYAQPVAILIWLVVFLGMHHAGETVVDNG